MAESIYNCKWMFIPTHKLFLFHSYFYFMGNAMSIIFLLFYSILINNKTTNYRWLVVIGSCKVTNCSPDPKEIESGNGPNKPNTINL